MCDLKRDMCVNHSFQLFATAWTITPQAPLSVAFSKQEYWSGLPVLSPGVQSDSGIKHRSPDLQADSLPSELPGKPPKWDAYDRFLIL